MLKLLCLSITVFGIISEIRSVKYVLVLFLPFTYRRRRNHCNVCLQDVKGHKQKRKFKNVQLRTHKLPQQPTAEKEERDILILFFE